MRQRGAWSAPLWTTSENEYRQLPIITKGDWRQEDVAWLAPDGVGTPVYRLYNKRMGDAGAIPLYCVYNKRLKKGQHHFTRSLAEKEFLTTKAGWRYEKEAFYGYPPA